MPRLNLKIDGLNSILSKVDANNPFYTEPWNKAIKRATEKLEERVESASPMRTGRLTSSITSRLDAKKGRFSYGIVTTNASNKGFRYPFALEAGKGKKFKSGAHSVLHHWTGSRRGKSTKGWFSGAKRGFAKLLQPLLAAAAQEIEARWRR